MDRALRRKITNNIFVVLCGLATIIALAFLVMILWSLVAKGIGGLDAKIFTMTEPAPGSPGGLLNGILGSIMMCGMGMIIAVVIGLLAGTWLAEYGGKTPYGQVVRFFNDVLLSAPSIPGGLLGFARISGETAPLIFTSLGNQFINLHMTQPMASLPTTIFKFALSAYDDWQRLAWVGALLIAVTVLAVNIIGRSVARETHRP